MKLTTSIAISGLLLGSAALRASANDGAIAYGGSPSLLSGHPSVSMESELITMTVSTQTVTVDCQFVFKNHGKKTQVRMGFPDQGEGSSDPDEEYGDNEWKGKPARTTFNWFKSWVNGQPVKTQLIRSNQASLFWHAKTVNFAAGETKRIRDLYNVDTGGQIAPVGSGYYKQTSYVLHTGKSWHGNIGRSEVVVKFALPLHTQTLQPQWYRYSEGTYLKLDWEGVKGGRILYHGPVKASTSGLTMRFVRTNWKPTDNDDIWLAFDYQGPPKEDQPEKPKAGLPYLDNYPFDRTLTENDLKDKSQKQLRLMRNAIYARHGRPFKDAELTRYFNSQKWYHVDKNWKEGDDDKKLTPQEKLNAAFIAMYASSRADAKNNSDKNP